MAAGRAREVGTTALIDRTADRPEFGDVKIGSGDSTSSSVIPDARSAAELPERWRARKPAAHSPTETRTVPLSAGDAAARRRSSARAARSSRSAASTSDSPAALRRNPSGRRSNNAGPPNEASKPASRRPIVGWLSPSARPAARNEPLRATARKTRTSSQFIGAETLTVSMIRIRIAGRRFCRLLKSKCGAMILSLRQRNGGNDDHDRRCEGRTR